VPAPGAAVPPPVAAAAPCTWRSNSVLVRCTLGWLGVPEVDVPPVAGEAPAVDRPEPAAAPAEASSGLPEGYEGLTVAQIKEAASSWDADAVAAALDYEQAHGKRKGAIAALEAATPEEES